MGKDDFGPISQYNSLIDPNLQGYYSKSIIRHHLRQTGLINRKGEIIPEDVWRKKIQTKERMEQASRMIASKIVQQAIEIKNLERAEIRRKLEEVSKKELVKRIRGKSLQNRHLPLLWSNKDDSFSDSNPKRVNSRSVSPRNEDDDIKLLDHEDNEDDHRVFIPKPPKQKPLKKIRFRRRLGGGTRFGRGVSAQPKTEPIILTMIYYGKGIKIPYDTQVFDSKDEIAIYQQHCGGENLLVYSGLHEKGDKFTFQSKRHKEYPFGLTIFLNGRYDCRISTCCEYRHNLNVRIGANGSFGITNVSGDRPCVKCLWEKNQSKPKIIKQLPSVILDSTSKQPKQDEFKSKSNADDNDEDIQVIPVKNSILPANDDYDDEFDDQSDEIEWQIKVYTSNVKGGSLENSDVYISLIGSKAETERYLLSKGNSKTKNRSLFETGNCDEFLIKTTVDLEKLRQIRIALENGRSRWHLEKVLLTNKRDDTQYIFMCNNWLSNDSKLERILPEPAQEKDNSKKDPKLVIQMKHDQPIKISSKTATPVLRTPTPIQKSPSPSPFKTRTPSPDSIRSRSPTPVPLEHLDNSRRWTASDVMNIVREDDRASTKSVSSKSSSASASTRSMSQRSENKTKSPPKKVSEPTSSESSASDSDEATASESEEEVENKDRKIPSVYDQLMEQEKMYERRASKKSSSKTSVSKDKSRDSSLESKKSNSPKIQSRQSARLDAKDLVSGSKQSLASSISQTSSRVTSARDESRRSSLTTKEAKPESAKQSKTSFKETNGQQNDLSARSSGKSSSVSSRKSSVTSANIAKDDITNGRTSKTSEKQDSSRKSSLKKKSDSESDSDSSDSSTAKEEEEAEEDIKSVKSKRSTNLIADIIESKPKTPESRRSSHSSNKSKSPTGEQNMSTANGSLNKELTKSTSSVAKSQQGLNGSPTKSNSSLNKNGSVNQSKRNSTSSESNASARSNGNSLNVNKDENTSGRASKTSQKLEEKKSIFDKKESESSSVSSDSSEEEEKEVEKKTSLKVETTGNLL